MSDGKRKVVSIQEITGMEGEMVSTQDIFTFTQSGIDPEGNVLGQFRATGIRPKFVERLLVRGIEVGDELFDPTRIYE